MISNVNNNTSFSARISKETYNKIQRLPEKAPILLEKQKVGI